MLFRLYLEDIPSFDLHNTIKIIVLINIYVADSHMKHEYWTVMA